MPIKYALRIFQTQDSVKYNGAINSQFTVREMKCALSPLKNYSLRIGTILKLYDSRRKIWSASLQKGRGLQELGSEGEGGLKLKLILESFSTSACIDFFWYKYRF